MTRGTLWGLSASRLSKSPPQARIKRTCIHSRGMRDWRRILPSIKANFRRHPDGWQENLTKSGGKRAAKTHSTAVNTGSKACLKNIRHTEMPKGFLPWASLIIPAQKMLRRLSPGGLTRPDRPCAPGRLPSAPRRCRRGRSAPSPARRPGRLRSGPPGRSAPPAIWWCRRRGAP